MIQPMEYNRQTWKWQKAIHLLLLFFCSWAVLQANTVSYSNHSYSLTDSSRTSVATIVDENDDLTTISSQITSSLDNIEAISRARELTCKALEAGRFIQKLDELAWMEFPVVIGDTISNVPIHIVFDNLRMYPTYAELEIVVQIQLPQRNSRATVGELNGSQAGAGSPAGPRPCDTSTPPSQAEYIDLYFGTPSLKFSHDGGIIGETLIGLYADYPIGTTDPSKFAFILNAWHEHRTSANADGLDLGTYVKIDCDGFVEMGVEADVFFSREWIIPVDNKDNPKPTGRVKGHIQTVVNDWQNLLVEINLPNFAPTDYPNIAFNLSTAVFDFSDFRNSPNVVFPAAYAQQQLLPGNANLWRGVYIRNLELSLPKEIKEKGCVATTAPTPPSGSGTGMLLLDETGTYAYGLDNMLNDKGHGPMPPEIILKPSKEFEATETTELAIDDPANNCRVKIGVNHLLIDGHGVSGTFYAEQVLPLSQGSLGGWRFSLEDLDVKLVCSKVTAIGFGGKMTLPIQKKDDFLTYSAFIDIPERAYSFSVGLGQDKNFPLFKMAEVTILAGSYVEVDVVEGEFDAAAVLYGSAGIKAKLKSEEAASAEAVEAQDDSQEPDNKLIVKMPRIVFGGLRLATSGTKLSLLEGATAAERGFIRIEEGDAPLLANFPISIANPSLTNVNGRPQLGFDVSLNLMGQNDNGFAATTRIVILASFSEEDNTHQWKNAGVRVTRIEVDIRLSALKIYGYANIFDNDPGLEDYGKGFQGSLTVEVAKNGTPYVTVELNAIFGRTTFKYWYVDGFVEVANWGVPIGPITLNGFGGGAYYHMRNAGGNLIAGGDGSVGTLPSGIRYVPDIDIVLGLKATVAFVSTGTDVLDGIATLELVFSGTGLQEIIFYGKAEIAMPSAVSDALTKFSDELGSRISDLYKPKSEMEALDEAAADAPQDQILASAFIRLNFNAGFELQGTLRMKMTAAQGMLTANGTIDLLISTPQSRWHLYIGGYHNNALRAGDDQAIPPIGVQFNLGDGIHASAGVYLLVGNDIPGPPPLHPAAAAFFNVGTSTPNNRASLGGSAAAGTGFAFGSFLFASVHKNFGPVRVDLEIGAGFDVSLLKYASNTYCSLTGDSPHGHKGRRATGQIWFYADGKARFGIRVNVQLGVLAMADVPNPNWVQATLKVKFLVTFDVNVEVGNRCGTPYQ